MGYTFSFNVEGGLLQDVIAGYSLGANSYVRKPVDFAEFLEAVKILGIYWLALNQVPPPQ